MSLVESVHESGVVLVEETRDHSALRRALKQIDPRLRLLSPETVFPGTPPGYWRVVCLYDQDRPAVPVLTWMTPYGDPLPLTSRILDEVNRHRLDGRGYGKTSDERNDDLKETVAKERRAQLDAIHDEYEAHLERGRVGVSLGATNKVPYWMRQHRGGYER